MIFLWASLLILYAWKIPETNEKLNLHVMLEPSGVSLYEYTSRGVKAQKSVEALEVTAVKNAKNTWLPELTASLHSNQAMRAVNSV